MKLIYSITFAILMIYSELPSTAAENLREVSLHSGNHLQVFRGERLIYERLKILRNKQLISLERFYVQGELAATRTPHAIDTKGNAIEFTYAYATPDRESHMRIKTSLGNEFFLQTQGDSYYYPVADITKLDWQRHAVMTNFSDDQVEDAKIQSK